MTRHNRATRVSQRRGKEIRDRYTAPVPWTVWLALVLFAAGLVVMGMTIVATG